MTVPVTSDARWQDAVHYVGDRTPDSFWRWAADGQALEWADGRTIAFRGEVAPILAALAPRGLPPFDAVVLLLAACRDGYRYPAPLRRELLFNCASVLSGEGANPGGPNAAMLVRGVFAQRLHATLRQVSDGLDAISLIPAELRQSPEAKALIAQTVFETAIPAVDARVAAAVLELIEGPINFSQGMVDFGAGTATGMFAAALDALAAGLGRLDADRLRLRARTGLEQLPIPATIPDEPASAARVRELIQQLRSDRELGGLARLAQNLMAAVHVPRALHAAEELPMGGVSDLTNRGDFDRLLISELAYDDLTLAVRVALNEALYLRRESPPRRPPPRRAVLIDCGIRLWGVGRVFASAVAMALAAGSDPRGELAVYRAAGAGIVPVDLASREGIIALLEALEPHPHPGAALPAFLAAAGGGRPAAVDIEWLLVTHADVLADPEFARQIDSLRSDDWLAATVDRDGLFALTAMTSRGRRLVCSAELSLDEILAPAPTGSIPLPLRVEGIDRKLPAILSCDPMPLRLPYALDPKQAVASDKLGLFGITHDGRVLWWETADRGPRQLTDVVPPGRLLGLFLDRRRGQLHLAMHDGSRNRLHHVAIAPESRHIERRQITMNAPQQVHYHEPDGVLFLIGRRTVGVVSLLTGLKYNRLHCPAARWTNGRFFVVGGKRCALTLSGSQIMLEPVCDECGIALLDLAGHPCLLTDFGTLDSLDGKPPPTVDRPFSGPTSLVGVSPDGERAILRRSFVTADGSAPPPRVYLREFSVSGEWRPVAEADVPRLLVGEQIAWSRGRVPPAGAWSYRGMFVDSKGELRLLTYRRETRACGFILNDAGELVLTDLGVSNPRPDQLKVFEEATPPPGRGYPLRVARWSDGSQAYLDGRGALHLKSSENIPEVSLVFDLMILAGWSSDGKTFGPKYFLDGEPTADAAYALDLIRQFTLRLR